MLHFRFLIFRTHIILGKYLLTMFCLPGTSRTSQEKKYLPVFWYHTGFSPAAIVQLYFQGRRGVWGDGEWGRGGKEKHPSARLRIYWLPIFPPLQVGGFHSSCPIWSLWNHRLGFPEHHSAWRAVPASLWAVTRFPFESHAGLLPFTLLSVPLAASVSLCAQVYSAVFSSVSWDSCHRRLLQPNWNSLYLSHCPIHWANVHLAF